MKKKSYFTRTVKISSLILAVLLSLLFLQNYGLRRLDHNSLRLNGYYHEQPQSVDVVLLGASEIYTAFSSCRAYERFGFTSYPYATESITAAGTLTALKEIVRTQKPKLILIETNAFLYGHAKNETHEGHVRKLIDNVPLNQNKIDFISQVISPEEQIEYYLPLIKYHGTWTEYFDSPEPARNLVTTIRQDLRGFCYLKGFRTTTDIFEPRQYFFNRRVAAEDHELALHPELEKKLTELLDYCKAQQLRVAFIRMPHLITSKTSDRVRRSNSAAKLVRSYGYDYLNLERQWRRIGIDLQKDFYNYDHLNIYGTVKMTDYIGKLICDKYGVGRSELTAEQKKNWDESARQFEKLTRYCDDLIQNKHKVVRVIEDVDTLQAIQEY